MLGCLCTFGCYPDNPTKEPPSTYTTDLFELPEGFDPLLFPEDNGFTDVRWALGRRLFYENRLSLDGNVSCATCHLPDRAFSAPEAVTPGAFGVVGERNASTLTNVAYQPHFMSEGGVPTLEMQVLVPLQEPSEFAHNIVTVCEELQVEYAEAANAAYGRELDPFVLTRALATFQRSLISGNALWGPVATQRGHHRRRPSRAALTFLVPVALGVTVAIPRRCSPAMGLPTTASNRCP